MAIKITLGHKYRWHATSESLAIVFVVNYFCLEEILMKRNYMR